MPTNNSIFGLVTRFNNTENRNLVKKIDVFFRGITPGTRFPIYSLHVEMREGETIRLIIKKNGEPTLDVDIYVPMDEKNYVFNMNSLLMYFKILSNSDRIKAFADATSVADKRGLLPRLPNEIKKQEISSYLGGRRRTKRKHNKQRKSRKLY